MKKRVFISLILASFLSLLNVNAACLPGQTAANGYCYSTVPGYTDVNKGRKDCSLDNAYYNPTQMINARKNDNINSHVVYNIAFMDIDGDTLNLYGWAFNNGYDNVLGNSTNIKIRLSNNHVSNNVFRNSLFCNMGKK